MTKENVSRLFDKAKLYNCYALLSKFIFAFNNENNDIPSNCDRYTLQHISWAY